MEGGLPTLDQHVATSSATRNVAMNIFETLVIRDENMSPTPDLAASIEVSDDGLTYTFPLREGAKFHNGKPLTSADVAASFDRYDRIGVNRAIFDVVDRWEASDDMTFVIYLKEAQPTFLESLSSYTVPIVIIPSEQADKEANQVEPIGTGPFKFVEFVPDSHVLLEGYEDYTPNETLSGLSGFAGYKQPCVDTVRFRMLTEAGRSDGRAGDRRDPYCPRTCRPSRRERLENVEGVDLVRLQNYALNVGYPNWSAPPTDNLKVRQAMLAALDMEEIMEAATDGAYTMNPALQFPDTDYYSDAGSELHNQQRRREGKEAARGSGICR